MRPDVGTDPRGPVRTIEAVEATPSGTFLLLSCAHVVEHNQIYTYRVGDSSRCFTCRKEHDRG